MSQSPNLQLPFLDANQNQKTVTHNAALLALDALVNCTVQSAALAAPPTGPADGQRWIVAPGATGAWAGRDLVVAAWQDGAWAFYPPGVGMLAYNIASAGLLLWNGTAWVTLSSLLALLGITALGIGTAPDSGNPLSATLNAALFNALGTGAGGTGDVRVKLNKAAAGNTASFLFQDGFAGRAEIGLTGDDSFHFKVSADGTTFLDALGIAPTTGVVSAPFGLTSPTLNGAALAAAGGIATLDAGSNVVQQPQAVAAYAGGIARTTLDRFGDYIVAHDLSDGTRSAANDQAALTAAINAAAASPSKAVLITRPFQVSSTITVPAGVRLLGVGPEARIIPLAAVPAFLVTAGRVWIEDLKFAGSSSVPLATFVQVNKPFDNARVYLRRLEVVTARYAVDWVDGDCPVIDDVFCANVVLALNFRNNGTNGHVSRLSTIGGSGLSIAKNAGATVPQQMEGTTFSHLNIVTGQASCAGVALPPPLTITAGLALRFFGVLIDQVWSTGGILVQGTTAVPVDDVSFFGTWVGTNLANQSGTNNGIDLEGAVSRVAFTGGKVSGFTGWGVVLNGQSSSTEVYRCALSGLELRGNGTSSSAGGDLLLANCDAAVMDCDFNSTTQTVYEVTNSRVRGDGNCFAIGPSQLSGQSNWIRSRGTGAQRGVPTTPPTLPGWLYQSTSLFLS